MSKMSKISNFIRNKKKPVLYMFVGLPASGKSYYTRKLAKKTGASIHSPDDIRRELYGDERIQGDRNTVFNTLHSRMKSVWEITLKGSDMFLLRLLKICSGTSTRLPILKVGMKLRYVIRKERIVVFTEHLMPLLKHTRAIVKTIHITITLWVLIVKVRGIGLQEKIFYTQRD